MERKNISKEKDFSTKIIDLNIPRGLKIFLSGSWLMFVIMGHLFLSVFKFFNLNNDVPKSSEQKQLEEEEEEYYRREEEEYYRRCEEDYYNCYMYDNYPHVDIYDSFPSDVDSFPSDVDSFPSDV
ncbi:hypothetical protein [Actinobacillus delphinicola]|uniref:Uncharacterized protein n=1 Tax=Actinobacillus delphinicola TaxID=51161 RepID=A0A448TTS0_9PAST|nr:hypothetical protein [Actinobacillus delphinicola]VEJ09397.1 Uncharacterised protein [Actinobacillus delphinicola]